MNGDGGTARRRPPRRSIIRGAGSAVLALTLLSWAAAKTTEVTAAAVTNPLEGRGDLVEDGRGLFNQYCAHCHGPNAIQGERPRDLRRLKVRYGQEAPQVYYQAVNHGRLDKGMPVWKGVLSDDALWRIFTYLQTVQTPP
jgi:mono/diheme cytochrome c family protein